MSFKNYIQDCCNLFSKSQHHYNLKHKREKETNRVNPNLGSVLNKINYVTDVVFIKVLSGNFVMITGNKGNY